MKRRTFLQQGSAAGLITLITPSGLVQASAPSAPADPLAAHFLQPPASARAQTWWHWMNGHVTADGITRDLEAMKAIGLGGFQNFDAGTGIPKGPLVYLSPEWLSLKEHAINEAGRLGLEFTMHNCPGWSSSGGPWITPERAMQQVTWSETSLSGGHAQTVTLPQPLTRLGYYRDVRVLAFPALPGEEPLATLVRTATAGGRAADLKQLTGETDGGVLVQPAEGATDGQLLLEFNEPYEARSLTFISAPAPGATPAPAVGGAAAAAGSLRPGGDGVAFRLAVSDDGVTFRPLAGGTLSTSAEPAVNTYLFTSTTARFFRLTTSMPRRFTQLRLSNAPRLAGWDKKTNVTFSRTPPTPDAGLPAAGVIQPGTLVDLTAMMDRQGVLTWNVPAGNWTVLRLGFTPLGALNRSAPDTGIGLECDKYSAEAITFHFNKMMDHLLPTLGPLAAKGRVGLLIDSYEIGMQNWTPTFPDEFSQRAGYDMTPFLPALTGRVMTSTDTTERFLWDFRRTQADLMADKYYGTFQALCRQHRITAYAEPYDRGPMEEMQIGARVNVNMGEFWNGLSTIFQNNWSMRRTTKLAASIAHTNGQPIVGAESFTGEPESSRWQEYPFAMKATGDKMFTQGLNRIIFHCYAHQPHPTARPGMTMGPWGIHFDRATTWWSVGRGWLDYVARCQYLLQQGLFVADLAYFTGEDGGVYTDVTPDVLSPAPPPGYEYDLINAETLRTKASVRANRLVLPDGMSYRVLVLQHNVMTLDLLRTLRGLVRDGLWLVGPAPERTPGLRYAATGEAEFAAIVAELWGTGTGDSRHQQRVGNGLVFHNTPLLTILEQAGVTPDVVVTARSGDAPVTWLHRRVADADVYFLANQRRTTEELVCTFRVTGRQPDVWDANTGVIAPSAVFEQADGHTRVPVQLGPSGSLFVVFRRSAPARQLLSVSRDNRVLLGTRPFVAAPRTLYPTVTNTFTIGLRAKPELNIMLDTRNFMDQIADPWTDYYAVYPASGHTLYGQGHETAGLTVGRNGVALWHNAAGTPMLVLAAPTPISGWSTIVVVYDAGTPTVYVNGKLILTGKATGKTIHPGAGEAYLSEGASYYNGDMTRPRILSKALSQADVSAWPVDDTTPETLPVRLGTTQKGGLQIWQDGRYTLRDNKGHQTPLVVSGVGKRAELTGPWQVSFPPDLGAPAQITLPRLMSLSTHTEPGVRHFSGTATYQQTFSLPVTNLSANRRLVLDLGRVEVIADVTINGHALGTHWTRPYQLDITDAVRPGANTIDIRVTNLWPNRLIGDEYLPDEDRFTAGAGRGGFASLSGGAIEALPDWYTQGKPKPAGGRVTFTTWKHFTRDSPLLESGLIGPVTVHLIGQYPA